MTTPEPDASAGESTIQLLIRARSGDDEALDRLYSLYERPFRRWASGKLPRELRGLADTDDLVQETLMRSLRGVDAFDPQRTGAFLSYLKQGFRNRIKDELRRVRRRPTPAGTARNVPDPRPLPVDEAIDHEAMDRYEEALARLRPDDREAILARIEFGLTYPQIAQALGKPSEDAARVATRRAIERLAREMAHVR